MECEASSTATTPGEATTTTTTTTVTTASLDTPTPTTPLPPPSPHLVTTTDNTFALEEPPGGAPPPPPPPPQYEHQQHPYQHHQRHQRPPPQHGPPRRSRHQPPLPLLGPPPSYEECHPRDSPPPTYDSLFGRVREVQKTSNGIMDFVKNLVILLLGTVGCTVMIGVTIVVPVFMIIIGAVKMNNCPAQPHIPVYLVVGGVLGVTKPVLGVQTRLRRPLAEDEGLDQPQAPIPWHRRLDFSGAINFFLTAWFIVGCVWVYRIYQPNYTNKTNSNYCDKTLYLFAFWLVTSVYIITGLLVSCLCGLSIATVVLQHSRGVREEV